MCIEARTKLLILSIFSTETPVFSLILDTALNLSNSDNTWSSSCLLYTSDAADEGLGVDLGGRRIIKKKIKEGSVEVVGVFVF